MIKGVLDQLEELVCDDLVEVWTLLEEGGEGVSLDVLDQDDE